MLFFVAALLCKITFIAAPVACSAMLIKQKRWRELTYLVLGVGGVLGATVAALQWSTHGAFLFHQLETHVDPWSWRNYCRHVTVALVESSTLVALALCGILRLHRFNQPLAYLIAAGLGTVTLLKVGSASNHLLEFEAALCISAAVGMQQLQAMRRHPRATLAMVATVACVLAGGAVARRAMYSTAGLVDQCPQAYAYIQNHQAVLSENVGALLLTARPVLLSNPYCLRTTGEKREVAERQS